MKTKQHDHANLGWLVSIPPLLLAGLAACQPGEQDDGLEITSEGSSGAEGSTSGEGSTGAEGSTGSGVDTTHGSSTEASSTSPDDESSTTDPDPSCGDGVVSGIEDCDGADLLGATCESLGFVVGTLTCDADCVYDYSACVDTPTAPTLMLGVSAIKRFDFSWAAVPGITHYQLEERAAPGEPFVQLGEDIVGESVSHTMPLHLRHEATYRLRACNVLGCAVSAEVGVMSSLVDAVGYFKASNAEASDDFGRSMALSADGSTLVVSAPYEDSSATGIDGDQANDLAEDAGAVYVFTRNVAGGWSQQAYLKASNTDSSDRFGESLAISPDGNTLAVGTPREDSSATGIDGNQANDSVSTSGAVYVFVRDGMGAWSQQAYVKASNTGLSDNFGRSVALSGSGDTLAVGAPYEDSGATGIDGDQTDDSAGTAGATYVFVRDGMGVWSQQAYVKASNTSWGDYFGFSVDLSEDGDTLAVGAFGEDSNATGIDGDQANDLAGSSGAAYVFVRSGLGTWSQQAYVKASNTSSSDQFGLRLSLSGNGDTLAVSARQQGYASGAVYVLVRSGLGTWSQAAYLQASNSAAMDYFGESVVLSADGNVLAVGAFYEDGDATGIGGDQANDSAVDAGAAYVFARSGMGAWSQRAYVKAPNTDAGDFFGESMALSPDGLTLAIGAPPEASNGTGIGDDQADDTAIGAGAVYLY